MKITSHFVWLEIISENFIDLFCELQKYLRENNIENILEFQNLLSLHITLYYLWENIPENFIFQKNIWDENLLENFDYFKKENREYICYGTIKNTEILKSIFNELHIKYDQKNIFENTLDYIPHITFFKIKNFLEFQIHQKNIEKILQEELWKIIWNITTKNIFLYKVNSEFSPELQIKIN